MEGFDMNDWMIHEEDWDEDEGRHYKHLGYKNPEGLKTYHAWYWTPEEIYVEVWLKYRDEWVYIEGGLS